MDAEMNVEEVRGASPAMTTKELLWEVYTDMKAVRPKVEVLYSQDLDARVRVLEQASAGRAGGDRRVITTDTVIRGWLSTAIALIALALSFVLTASRLTGQGG